MKHRAGVFIKKFDLTARARDVFSEGSLLIYAVMKLSNDQGTGGELAHDIRHDLHFGTLDVELDQAPGFWFGGKI